MNNKALIGVGLMSAGFYLAITKSADGKYAKMLDKALGGEMSFTVGKAQIGGGTGVVLAFIGAYMVAGWKGSLLAAATGNVLAYVPRP